MESTDFFALIPWALYLKENVLQFYCAKWQPLISMHLQFFEAETSSTRTEASNKGQLQFFLTERQHFHRFWLFLKILLVAFNFPSNPAFVSFSMFTLSIFTEKAVTETQELQGKCWTKLFNALLYSRQFSSTTVCFRQKAKKWIRCFRMLSL